MRKVLVVAVLAAAAALAGVFSYRQLTGSGSLHAVIAAPPMRFATLDGKTLTLASLHGRWVLLNFWASWCAPCMDELPHLVAAQSNFGALGLQIIGPAIDEPDAVRPMVDRFHINYPVTADVGGGSQAMAALGNDAGALPFTVLIDPEGFVVERVMGGMSAAELQELLNKHLRS